MKTIRLIRESLLFVAALTLVACASEDTQQKDERKQPETKFMATFTGAHLVKRNSQAKSRTTATHTRGSEAKVFWTATDKIWVKADDGRFYQSEAADFAASATPADHSRANFHLSAGFYATSTAEVRYTGASTDVDHVTIAAVQTQASPNDFSHLGAAGDCGTATAHSGALAAGDYEFTLDHKASYLCFVPRCMHTGLGPNVKLTKIVVTADKPIAGTYDFSDGTLKDKTPTGGSNTITLNLGSANDFSLNTTTDNLAMNAAYMVLAPGTYNLTIAYTLKDVNGVSGDLIKTETGFACKEGQIRDITANLTPPTTPPNFPKFYMWDAQKDYWWGHESDQTFGGGVPGQGYPQSSTDPRWYNPNYPGVKRYDAQTAFFKTLPNANEMAWYAAKGKPHWDAGGGGSYTWIERGHLRNLTINGMWLMKKNAIVAYLKAHEGYPATLTWEQMKEAYWDSPTGIHRDFRVISYGSASSLAIQGRPSATEIGDYFFLPACGLYENGNLLRFGEHGYYWSSSGAPEKFGSIIASMHLFFGSSSVSVNGDIYRYLGVPARPFE